MTSRTSRQQYNRRARLHCEQGGKCFYCNEPMRLAKAGSNGVNPPNYCTIDHVIPRSRGGKLDGNAVAACHACNNERGDQDARLFLLQKQGMI